ncbi:MAG: hypothetical protein IKI94_03950 [Ruminococcus sp.]|nr:hypothetical protein [Ruminococcus sp.]
MKNIIKKSISLIFTAVLCSVFVLPVSASASAKKTVKHIDDITETSEFDNCGIISQIGLFDEEEFDELNELVRDTAEEINMYVCVVLGTNIYSDASIEEFADLFYEDMFGENTDGLIYYMDLSGRYEAYDYISTSGRAMLVYTDYENDGFDNRIDDIFDKVFVHLPSSGETIEADDISAGITELCNSLESINEKGPKKFYYHYDKFDDKYIYIKNEDVIISRTKPFYAIIKYAPIGLLVTAIVALISILSIKSSYKFRKSFSSSSYVEKDNTMFNVRTDTFIREYTRKTRIQSSSGGAGGRSGGGSHGGGGRHR